MRFENFDLESPAGSVIVVGEGHFWDLHNFADFEGFTFNPEANTLDLTWMAPEPDEDSRDDPWGDLGNHARGCIIRCFGMRQLILSERDPEIPPSESTCLEAISKVAPQEGAPEFRESWAPDEEFALLLEFHDDRTIQIDCQVARLEVIG